uniref:Protein sleepless n=1 Tax=Bursaphelenchus xylophilus TaxID=6326 RepID=A0A1I7SFB7_BURXY
MLSLKICSFFSSLLVLLHYFSTEVAAVNCLQCSGWNGKGYAPRSVNVNPCENPNNACTTNQFCVKIIDPIFKHKGYKTYKSDCYASTTFASYQNTTTIESGRCYNYTDGASPPKTYYYCFCNNRDYCNSTPGLAVVVLVPFSLSLLSYLVARRL